MDIRSLPGRDLRHGQRGFQTELYTLTDPHCTSRVLWYKFERKIVSNESSEIIRIPLSSGSIPSIMGISTATFAGSSTIPDYGTTKRRLFQHPKIHSTVMAQINVHYFGSHPWLNPTGILPIGPVLDVDAPVRPLSS
jgi:glutathionyl-hydroquinone reductase